MGSGQVTAAYLDASAFVKLFKPERESPKLREALREFSVWLSSELLGVEARCTARRLPGERALGAAEAMLGGVELIPFRPAIADRAGASFDTPLRALDAIHVATALSVGDRIDAVFAYDSDLITACAELDLPTRSPARDR